MLAKVQNRSLHDIYFFPRSVYNTLNDQKGEKIMANNKKVWLQRRRRLSEILEAGASTDFVSRSYDVLSTLMTLVNIAVTVMYTFDQMQTQYGRLLLSIEAVTVAFFGAEYVLRLWTAQFVYPNRSEWGAVKKYVTSFTGIVDLLSFLPYYLPVFFPAGAAVFRMFRAVRIFRLFQINAYYNSIHAITAVISSKRPQLISSV
jgi:voltage-gated potassium channel